MSIGPGAAKIGVPYLVEYEGEQWKAEGDDSGAFDGHEVAARIRAALEGAEE